MTIKTKSAQAKASKTDGIRVCIMRRISPELVFDIWIPALAPSTELLKNYHDKKVDWGKFESLFTKEVLNKKQKYFNIIMDIAEKNTLTLLCWEKTPEKCHRRLVAEQLKKLIPDLKINLN